VEVFKTVILSNTVILICTW